MKGIADMLDSDMEDSAPLIDENSILSSASDATNAPTSKPAPAKRAKKRQRVTMPKPKPKATTAASIKATKRATTQTAGVKRKATQDLDEVDVDEDLVESVEVAHGQEGPITKGKKRGRPNTKTKPAPADVNVTAQETEDELVETAEPPIIARSSHASSKTKQPLPKVIPNNVPKQANASKQSRTIVAQASSVVENAETHEAENLPSSPLPKPRVIARNTSKSRQDQPFRRRAGSASDTERGDPNLRRKLGDVTRKFENVDLKYRNLKEVGINEANANMDKLRKQCDATMQASNDLIASLKKELASQTPLAQEARKLKNQMQKQEDEMNKMRESATDLTSQLATAQNEIKALQAKVAAARTTSGQAAKNPGSAIKKPGQRQPVTNQSEAENLQMRLDLYSDLTGLVVLGVKPTEEGDTYECIQTGQNGTLHFRLFIDRENAKTMSFEETEYLYTPLLDADRDHEMIELMPTYLTEEITFARLNASKFYGRVVDTLTKKRAEE